MRGFTAPVRRIWPNVHDGEPMIQQTGERWRASYIQIMHY